MANRRMFSLQVVDTDRFLDMPATARLLYYDLGMRADDDGFLQNAQRIARTIGAGKDDLALLVAKGFVIPFESGVVVIRHWCVSNQIRKDRHNETLCIAEKAQLGLNAAREYVFANAPDALPISRLSDSCQTVANLETQYSLGQSSSAKDRRGNEVADAPPARKTRRFIPPTVDDVKAYCAERRNHVDAQRFVDFYTANGWKVGKNSMKDWKAAVRTWERNDSLQKEASSLESIYGGL